MEITVAGTYLRECYAVNQVVSIFFDDIPVQKHMNRGWIAPASIPGISRG